MIKNSAIINLVYFLSRGALVWQPWVIPPRFLFSTAMLVRIQDLRNELDAHLTALRRSGRITTWYDGELVPGEVWEQTIEQQLNKADIILLLISPDFMKSEYCYGKEMACAIDRHAAGTACVVPILLCPVDWMDTPFASLQMLPSNAHAVISSHWSNQDEGFENIAHGLRRTTDLLMKRATSVEPRSHSQVVTCPSNEKETKVPLLSAVFDGSESILDEGETLENSNFIFVDEQKVVNQPSPIPLLSSVEVESESDFLSTEVESTPIYSSNVINDEDPFLRHTRIGVKPKLSYDGSSDREVYSKLYSVRPRASYDISKDRKNHSGQSRIYDTVRRSYSEPRSSYGSVDEEDDYAILVPSTRRLAERAPSRVMKSPSSLHPRKSRHSFRPLWLILWPITGGMVTVVDIIWKGVNYSILWWLITGLITGCFASDMMHHKRYVVAADIIAGLVGALIGGYLGKFSLGDNDLFGTIIAAFIAACVSIALMRVAIGDRPTP